MLLQGKCSDTPSWHVLSPKKALCLILHPYIKKEAEDTGEGGGPQLPALFCGRKEAGVTCPYSGYLLSR